MTRMIRAMENRLVSLMSFKKTLNYEVYRAVRSYLLKLYMETVKAENFELLDLFSFSAPGVFTFPSVSGFDTLDNVTSGESPMLGIIGFRGVRYLVSCTSVEDRFSRSYALFVSGDVSKDARPEELSEVLLKEAVRNSGLSGKILRIVSEPGSQRLTFKIIPPFATSLDRVYLKDKTELMDFISAVKDGNKGLRYLFIGEPGTGKTETARAIVSETTKLCEDLTVLLVDAGCGVFLEEVFGYAEILGPVLLCIDDIDLIAGLRDQTSRRKDLSTALEALDGFLRNEDIFVIATTNDRFMVDFALRRPGRFDLIIEFDSLDPEFYPLIVLRETSDEKLAEVFKCAEVVTKLSSLKVTGAFMVALVNYLKRERLRDKRYEKDTVLSVIDRLVHSFRREMPKKEAIGF